MGGAGQVGGISWCLIFVELIGRKLILIACLSETLPSATVCAESFMNIVTINPLQRPLGGKYYYSQLKKGKV